MQNPVKYWLCDYLYIVFFEYFTKKLFNPYNHIILTQIIFGRSLSMVMESHLSGNRITHSRYGYDIDTFIQI